MAILMRLPCKAKLLSLYQSDVHVIVRGKAGAEVEFGNGLFLAESKAGFIIDHELRRERPPDDGRWLRERLDKIKVQGGSEEMKVCADRGFDSAATTACLERKKVGNAICPRRPQELERRGLEDPDFSSLLRRRAGTEIRIAIVKNAFLDGVPRAKGYEGRAAQVAWAVLTHNIWLVARLSLAAQAKEKLLAA